MSTAQMNLLISTNRIGTEASANPVCGELPVPLTVVTVILAHTEDHLLVAIQEVVRCLFTPLEGMVVPPGEIALTHPDCRDTLQGH
ncbi:Uncharacterised protein [Shigella sonnei]|nr:Uncharacterised protein [Shigella sonnei]